MVEDKFVIHGSNYLPFLEDTTIGKQLYKALLRHSHLQEAIIDIHTGRKVSYKELLDITCRLAQSLERCGYKQNDVISVCSENNLNFMCPIISAMYLGIIATTLNENYTQGELNHALNLTKPKVIFSSKQALQKILKLKGKFSFIKKIILLDCDEDVGETESLKNFIERNSDDSFINFTPLDFDANQQVAVILCSSGTTGLPKGVMTTHRNLSIRFAHIKHPRVGTQTIPGVTVLQCLPLFHGFGFVSTLGYLIIGLRIIQLKRFQPELFLKCIQDYEVRSMCLAPPIIQFLAKSPLVDKYDLSSLIEIVSGAAPLRKEVIEAVVKRLNLNGVRQGYGLTESTLAVTITAEGEFRPGSSGTIVPLTSGKIIDIETGKSLGPNIVGELCFKGGMVMKGYIGDLKATKEAIDENGWLHTGDLAYYDEDGHFYVIDRLKELIKYKGFQVPPAELEALLFKHPCIKDAAVIGIPDEEAGELPTAFVVRQAGKQIMEKEVTDYIAGEVSSPKHLRGGVWFVEEIPKSASGKILRRVLRDSAVKLKSKL